jgi:hypothetical protein
MHRTQLEAILNDSASTEAEKTAAERALGRASYEDAIHDDTRRMLDALKVRGIADLTEEIYERYCAARSIRSSDWIVQEFRYWIPPDDSFLSNIGMNLGDWWLTVHRIAVAANRTDAVIHARRKLEGT